jgi:hypothetical protein
LGALAFPALVRSNTIDWINPAGGTFQVGSNWSGGAVPGTADTARFGLSGTPLDVTLTASVTADRLVVASGADVTFHTSSFNFVANSATSAGIVIGDIASPTPGRLDVATGRLGAFDIVLGDEAGAAGIGQIESGSWGSSRLFLIGNGGDGTFSASGSFANLSAVTLGSDSAARGFMHVDAGFLGANGPLRVGGSGAGTLLITGGTDIGTGPVIVADAPGSNGTIDLRSNVEWAVGTVTVGNGGSGTLLIGEGTMAGSGTTCVAQLPGSRGWLSINGGSVAFGEVNIGGSATAAGGDGTFVLDSGSISTFRALRAWDHGFIAWNDGTLGVGSIDLRGGGAMTMSAGPSAKLLKTKSVAIDLPGGSRLDVNDNDALLTGTTRSLVESYVTSARHGGDWNGAGLSSSSAKTQANHATTIGVLSGAEYIAATGTSTFDGSTVASSNVLVKYTWYGDTDFNGRVNFDDYVRVDNGFNNHLNGWLNGDLDFNGVVNFDDYVLIDLAFNTQTGTLGRALSYLDGSDGSTASMNDPALRRVVQHAGQFGDAYARSFLAAVPEPATPGLMCVLPIFLKRARSRRVKSVGEDRLRGSRRQGTALLASGSGFLNFDVRCSPEVKNRLSPDVSQNNSPPRP